MTDATAKPELYPQYCFRLSPTINRWCHFRISDILALRNHRGFEGQDVYFHRNHPIKWVRICGIVVAVNEWASRHIYTIDDGSGATLECVVRLAPGATTTTTTFTLANAPALPPSLDAPVDVGHLLDIKGSLGTFRGNFQVRAEKVAHLGSSEPEVVFWEKAAQLRGEVLARPWVLDRREVRRCRREEEQGAKRGQGGQHRRHRHERSGSGEGERGGKRRTGLEKLGVRETARAMKTDLAEAGLGRTESRKTGLERTGPGKTTSRTRGLGTTGPEKTESRTTGLDGTGSNETGLEGTGSRKPRLKTTGLETTGLARTEPKRTGLEASASRQPGSQKTGLEKAKVTGLESNASPAQDKSKIRKPLAERKARVTGLEKRKAAAPATRPIPMLGKYDALGL